MRLLLILTMVLISVSAQAKSVTVTDLAGRTVTIALPVEKIVLGEGRFLPTLAILEGSETVDRISGMMGEFQKYDPASYAEFEKAFPDLASIPLIGTSGGATFCIEQTFAVAPDLAIFGIGSGHSPNEKDSVILAHLEAAGIPVVFLDFRIDPIVNTPKSLRLLGTVLGREAKAEAFLTWYQDKLDLIEARLETVSDRPTVFLENRVGLRPECCEAMGMAMMGRFVTWAGGKNAYGDLIPGTHGMVNAEHLLTHQPDHYVGTAIGSHLSVDKFPGAIALGANTSETLARETLNKAAARPIIEELDAVKTGKAHAVWHHFYNTPMHVAVIEAMAQWLHPNLFADLDPQQTLATYFERFQPIDLTGAYWVSLDYGN